MSYPAKQPPSLMTIPTKGPTLAKKKLHLQGTPWAIMEGQGSQNPLFRKTLRRSILLLRRLGGYTYRVRSRAPAGKSKNPPGNSTRIAQGLGGYCRGPILGYPKKRS